jgi:hypothetical protein
MILLLLGFFDPEEEAIVAFAGRQNYEMVLEGDTLLSGAVLADIWLLNSVQVRCLYAA